MLPKALKPGDTIGIFSPSAPATVTAPKRFARACRYLQGKGFRIRPGSLTGKKDHYVSADAAARAEELNALIRNPDVSCVMPVIGGLNSNGLLPFIDYEAFRERPVTLVGFSDVTAILLAVFEKTKIPVYYGPSLVPSFGEFPPFVDMTFAGFQAILGGDANPPYQLPMPSFWTDDRMNWEEKTGEKRQHPNDWVTVHPGKARGRLVGGNLNAMTGIWGSPFMPEIRDGDILFIEDTSKRAAYMERIFTMLRLCNVFEKVSGIILGKHEQFDDEGSGKEVYEILEEVIGTPDIPILADVDCCHTHPMLTIPIGLDIELDSGRKSIVLPEKWID